MTGDGDVSGRLWVLAMEAQALKDIVRKGDIAVAGDLPATQLAAIELGVDLLVLSNGTRPVGRRARGGPRGAHQPDRLAAGLLRERPHDPARGPRRADHGSRIR